MPSQNRRLFETRCAFGRYSPVHWRENVWPQHVCGAKRFCLGIRMGFTIVILGFRAGGTAGGVALDIPRVVQMSTILMVLSMNSLLANTTFGSSLAKGRRPPLRPRALAAARPALVRSWISRRSKCASAENMLRTNSPEADVVSNATSF